MLLKVIFSSSVWHADSTFHHQNKISEKMIYLNIPNRIIVALVANKIGIKLCAP